MDVVEIGVGDCVGVGGPDRNVVSSSLIRILCLCVGKGIL